jgi:hypothetical protein
MRWLGIIVTALALSACSSSTKTNTTSATSTARPSATAKAGASPATISASPPAAGVADTATTAPNPTTSSGADVVVSKWKTTPGTNNVAFFGYVTNQGDADAFQVQVTATFYDAAGTVLGSSNAGVIRPIIPAGEISPFRGAVMSVDAGTVADTKFQVQFRDKDPGGILRSLYSFDVKVTQAQFTDKRLTGEVQNTGDKAVSLVAVLAIAYDANGDVLGVEQTFAKLQQIPAGETSAFDTPVSGYDTAPAKFDTFVYGHQVH